MHHHAAWFCPCSSTWLNPETARRASTGRGEVAWRQYRAGRGGLVVAMALLQGSVVPARGRDAADAVLLLKGLTEERLLFHDYINKQHNEENPKDSQLQAPWDTVLRALAREAVSAAQEVVVPGIVVWEAALQSIVVVFGDTSTLTPRT